MYIGILGARFLFFSPIFSVLIIHILFNLGLSKEKIFTLINISKDGLLRISEDKATDLESIFFELSLFFSF